MPTAISQHTANDLWAKPDDGFRYELVRGELRKMSPAGHHHGDLSMRLGWRLAAFVEQNKIGKVYAAETGFKIASNPDTVRAADAAFVCKERLEAVSREEGFWPGAPDLAIEVVSPSDRFDQVEEKVMDWLQAGTRAVWVVTPRNRSVTVYKDRDHIQVLTGEDTLEDQELLPGWKLPVKEIFSGNNT
jgi:Uma2 family endonuclease